MYLEYTGTVYNDIYKLPAPETWDVATIYTTVEEKLLEEDSITIAARPGFRDDYAIAVHETWATTHGVETLTELGLHGASFSIGTDPEFASRQDGLPQVEKVYGYTFGSVKQMQPTLMYEAIKNNEVDAISAYTTDARVDMYDLTILEDDKAAFPPYDAILITRQEIADNDELMESLAMLNDILDTASMRALNYEYDVEKREPRDIAYDFLVEQGLLEE
jgi:osmoprotectant transport system substrate-binding protein